MQDMADIATIVGGWATFFAFVYAFVQVRSTLKANREAAALEAYRDYLMACVERPEFSSYHMFVDRYPNAFRGGIGDIATLEVQQYLWFLSNLLNTVEQIAEHVSISNDEWYVVIKSQLGFHWRTLDAMWKQWGPAYSPRLGALVTAVIEDKKKKAAEKASVDSSNLDGVSFPA